MSQQTRCDLFGHAFGMWKEGGQYYMRCDDCAAVRRPTPADWKKHIDSNKARIRAESLTHDELLELIRNHAS